MFRRKKDDDGATTGPRSDDLAIPEANSPRPFPRMPTPPSAPAAPGSFAVARPQPAALAPRPTAIAPAQPAGRERGEGAEGRRLIVGREISLSGQITSCDKLIVEGKVEASLSDSRAIEIAEAGFFKGTAEIDSADISGRFEGTLIAREKLFIRSTGRIEGKIRYGAIEIEPGGEIVGDVQVVGERERPRAIDIDGESSIATSRSD